MNETSLILGKFPCKADANKGTERAKALCDDAKAVLAEKTPPADALRDEAPAIFWP